MKGEINRFTASFAAKGFDGKAPDSIVFFPVGTHSISASKGGEPVEIEMEITEDLAALLEADLQKSLAAAAAGTASRPFIDFEHTGGRAAALPLSFSWNPEKGVILALEWTPAGRDAIEGKEFSYFSPEWLMKDGKVTGLAQPGAIGALVNVPAFQSIGKIAASLNSMDSYLSQEILSVLLELGLITQAEVEQKAADAAIKRVRDMVAENSVAASLKTEAETIKAARVQADTDLVTARASITSLSKQIESDKEAHQAALKAVENSVNVKVAEIIKAAGVKTPVKTDTLLDEGTHARADDNAKSQPKGIERMIASLKKK